MQAITQSDVRTVMRAHGLNPTDEEVSTALERILRLDMVINARVVAVTSNTPPLAVTQDVANRLKRTGFIPLDGAERAAVSAEVIDDMRYWAEKFGHVSDERIIDTVKQSAVRRCYPGLSADVIDEIGKAYVEARCALMDCPTP